VSAPLGSVTSVGLLVRLKEGGLLPRFGVDDAPEALGASADGAM
jgi:hypothetical protein